MCYLKSLFPSTGKKDYSPYTVFRKFSTNFGQYCIYVLLVFIVSN